MGIKKLDVEIEPIELIEKVRQKLREAGLPTTFVARRRWKEFELNFENELTEAQANAIKNAIKQLIIEKRTENVRVYDPADLRDLTRQQLETYIENNINNLATAKVFIKKLAVMTLYLYKKMLEEE